MEKKILLKFLLFWSFVSMLMTYLLPWVPGIFFREPFFASLAATICFGIFFVLGLLLVSVLIVLRYIWLAIVLFWVLARNKYNQLVSFKK